MFYVPQQLQEEAGKGEALWAAVNKSCQSLVGSLHHGAAQALRDEVEGEQKRSEACVAVHAAIFQLTTKHVTIAHIVN